MPKFSAFTPFGILAFSSAPSELEKQYNALGTQLDRAFDTTPGQPNSEDNEAQKYALARHLARLNLTLKRAGYQRDVSKAYDILPLREADFLVTPGPYDTPLTRQQRLTAMRALPLGATSSNISTALTSLLGAGFLGLRVVRASEAVASLPTSNFQPQPLGLEAKFCALTQPIGRTGLQWVSYQNLDPTITAPVVLTAGGQVTVGGESNVQAEVVTVAAVQTTSAGVRLFQATFANAHDNGASITNMPFPRWTSTQNFLYVEVTPAVAANPRTRAQIDAIMAKLVRGVTQWAIVGVSGGTIGPFTIGSTPLGTSTLGTTAA